MGRGRKRRFESQAVEKVGDARRRDVGADREEAEEVKGFFACYLLCSLSPRHKCRTYIGFTVNPRRRIKQHNGERKCGAWRTKRGRPWEMVLCIYGFPSNVTALQFEWAWQHPTESLAVRKAASSFKSLSGVANKIKLAYTMLNLPSWENLNLTVNFFSTKYMNHVAACPRLPKQMKVNICSMDEIPCYTGGQVLNYSNYYEEHGCADEEFNQEVENSAVFDAIDHQIKENSCQSGNYTTFNLSNVQETETYDCELSESSKPFFESPTRMTESRRASCSSSLSSFSEDGDLGQRKHSSTPRSSINEAMSEDWLLSPKADVINLCTPSSCIMTKKTQIVSDVIDLTDSPFVIQL
ncbi:structure-specific endonuclease subunit SLX1 [Apostasia shenzhenica]|uniref:Structure-specific endonuclease subunit SLX1 homolog n=1 Tax=Apostasia shenzhenica TaxID=1088818 RepID=A0A2I0A4V7_9ASPA|nr:structure-specific endonuclease subunit SLX1 [Apostasia shenzhenica]